MLYEPRFHVVLFEPEIPYNAGSVGRTCVAIGAKLWLVRPLGFQLDDNHLRRAGMDYWKALEWEAVDDWNALKIALSSDQYWYFSTKGKRAFSDVEFCPGDTLVFGSESKGLPKKMLESDAAHCLRIPIRDGVRSLNLSNSVAVAAFEAVRRMDAP